MKQSIRAHRLIWPESSSGQAQTSRRPLAPALYGNAFLVLCFSRLRVQGCFSRLAITLTYGRRFHNRKRIAERDKMLAFRVGGTTTHCRPLFEPSQLHSLRTSDQTSSVRCLPNWAQVLLAVPEICASSAAFARLGFPAAILAASDGHVDTLLFSPYRRVTIPMYKLGSKRRNR